MGFLHHKKQNYDSGAFWSRKPCVLASWAATTLCVPIMLLSFIQTFCKISASLSQSARLETCSTEAFHWRMALTQVQDFTYTADIKCSLCETKQPLLAFRTDTTAQLNRLQQQTKCAEQVLERKCKTQQWLSHVLTKPKGLLDWQGQFNGTRKIGYKNAKRKESVDCGTTCAEILKKPVASGQTVSLPNTNFHVNGAKSSLLKNHRFKHCAGDQKIRPLGLTFTDQPGYQQSECISGACMTTNPLMVWIGL